MSDETSKTDPGIIIQRLLEENVALKREIELLRDKGEGSGTMAHFLLRIRDLEEELNKTEALLLKVSEPERELGVLQSSLEYANMELEKYKILLQKYKSIENIENDIKNS